MSVILPNSSTPATPASGFTEVFANSSKKLATVDDAATVRVFTTLDGVETFTNKTLTTPIINEPTITTGIYSAGTATDPPIVFNPGTNMTSPVTGAFEYDGAAYYGTIDTTSGRGQFIDSQIFRLTADGGAIGAAIADYFGANSAYSLVASGVYLIEYHCYFLKTTNGTVTWTITNTQTPVNLNAFWLANVITGFGATGAMGGAGVSKSVTAAQALPVTGSLSTATDHYHIIRVILEGNATPGNVRLRATESAGTITPRRGSYYLATRLSAGNVGTFVA